MTPAKLYTLSDGYGLLTLFRTDSHEIMGFVRIFWKDIDCKTVRIFAYSSTREQSKAANRERDWVFSLSPHTPCGRVRLARFARIRPLRHALPISLLILRKKPTILQSRKDNTQEAYLPKISIWGANCLWDISPVVLWKLHTNPFKFVLGCLKSKSQFLASRPLGRCSFRISWQNLINSEI